MIAPALFVGIMGLGLFAYALMSAYALIRGDRRCDVFLCPCYGGKDKGHAE